MFASFFLWHTTQPNKAPLTRHECRNECTLFCKNKISNFIYFATQKFIHTCEGFYFDFEKFKSLDVLLLNGDIQIGFLGGSTYCTLPNNHLLCPRKNNSISGNPSVAKYFIYNRSMKVYVMQHCFRTNCCTTACTTVHAVVSCDGLASTFAVCLS